MATDTSGTELTRGDVVEYVGCPAAPAWEALYAEVEGVRRELVLIRYVVGGGTQTVHGSQLKLVTGDTERLKERLRKKIWKTP